MFHTRTLTLAFWLYLDPSACKLSSSKRSGGGQRLKPSAPSSTQAPTALIRNAYKYYQLTEKSLKVSSRQRQLILKYKAY